MAQDDLSQRARWFYAQVIQIGMQRNGSCQPINHANKNYKGEKYVVRMQMLECIFFFNTGITEHTFRQSFLEDIHSVAHSCGYKKCQKLLELLLLSHLYTPGQSKIVVTRFSFSKSCRNASPLVHMLKNMWVEGVSDIVQPSDKHFSWSILTP